ncbi:MAG: penicillin-binding protein activator [bacterium]|nr:penicillin-binding protein activator [bacterium]
MLIGCSPEKTSHELSFVDLPNSKGITLEFFGPVPPWQMPLFQRQDGSVLDDAVELEAGGQLSMAEAKYLAAISEANNINEWREILLRRYGVLLKQGKGSLVSSELSALVAKGGGIESSTPEIALLMASAYLNERNHDQVLAWASLGNRKIAGKGSISPKFNAIVDALLASIPQIEFDQLSARWGGDAFVTSRLSVERLRRLQAGRPSPYANFRDWFNESSYAGPSAELKKYYGADATLSSSDGGPTDSASPVPSSDLVEENLAVGDAIKFGILLPFTGQYSQFAAEIFNGVVQALEEDGKGWALGYEKFDTTGDPLQALTGYNQLVSQGAGFIFGPLLLSSVQQIVADSVEKNVPIMTFARKNNLSELSGNIFQLGVTAEDQARDVIGYASTMLRVRTYAIFYPKTNSGLEMLDAFRDAVREAGGEVLLELSYVSGDAQSSEVVVERLAAEASPEAIIMVDSIAGSMSLLEALQASSLVDRTIVATASWDDQAMLSGIGNMAKTAVFPAPFHSYSYDIRQREFAELYQLRNHSKPTLLAAQGYDAAALLVASIKDGNRSLKPRVGDYEGVSGMFRVSADGKIRRESSVLLLQNGEVNEVVHNGRKTGFIPYGKADIKH